ncbi:MAG: hypothetical protein M3237_17715 [Actinomycetota bacterium]|nr:hypothetical protein [Actinomycetota bacterium]
MLASALEHRETERVGDADERDDHRDTEQRHHGAGEDVELEVDPGPVGEAVLDLGLDPAGRDPDRSASAHGMTPLGPE